jgi:L-rhamnose mutarotase
MKIVNATISVNGSAMQRIAFQLRIKPGMEEEYDEAHRQVWPELLAELESFGVAEYSIFRRGEELFLYLHAPDRSTLFQRLEASDVNQRWQARMAPVFQPVPSLQPGQTVAFMEEVCFFRGRVSPRE